MPVAKLFWDDPYLASCDAMVTGVHGDDVTVDRTVYFAFSGGQSSDSGTIGGLPVLGVRTDGLEIAYTLPSGHGLAPGQPVRVQVDLPTRLAIMRLHFAAELVLELVTRGYGRPEKVGANITASKARVDFVWDGSIAPILPEVADRVRELVDADLPIVSAYQDEASQRRYWRIDGFAQVPCGGTHPRRTGEVGRVRLKRANPGAGIERIEITFADGAEQTR